MPCSARDCDETAHLEVIRDGNPEGGFCSWRCLARHAFEAWEKVEGL